MTTERKHPPLPWRVPAVAAVLGLLVWWGDLNLVLFKLLNGIAATVPAGELLALTLWGNALAGIALISGWSNSRPRIIWATLFAVLPGVLFVRGLKLLLALPRPAAVLDPESITVVGPVYTACSLPSGHATTAFAIAAVVCCLSGNRWLRGIALGLACLVAASRVIVGAHWPLDVLVGATGGWLCGYLGVRWASRFAWTMNDFGRRGAAATAAICGFGLLVTRYDLAIEANMGIALFIFAIAMASFNLLTARHPGAWRFRASAPPG